MSTPEIKREKQPNLICWGCAEQDDKLFPHPCRLFQRFQGEGTCTRLKPKSGGVS